MVGDEEAWAVVGDEEAWAALGLGRRARPVEDDGLVLGSGASPCRRRETVAAAGDHGWRRETVAGGDASPWRRLEAGWCGWRREEAAGGASDEDGDAVELCGPRGENDARGGGLGVRGPLLQCFAGLGHPG
jgi:hypothetical protein